jgi:peptidoglycan/xylan/chitin deacetylase (PgdA/CDA1 family)
MISEKNALIKYGYKIILWDIDTGDYKPNISANKIIKNVIENIGGNKIILFHDSDYQCNAGRQNTVSALPDIIDSLKVLGYNFVTIDEMKGINQ